MYPRLLPGLLVMCILPHISRQYVPVDKLEDCAFILDEDDGRSSLYEYTSNILHGHISYSGPRSCITYDAINEAYLEARKRVVIDKPSSDVWYPDEVASVGELLLDITAQIAKTYGLTQGEIEKALPEIDTSKTFIREVCPPYMAHVECKAGKYRRHDGLCNNVKHPTWGATNTPFQRLLMPTYADSLSDAKTGEYGSPLPIPRIVSRTMHQDEGHHDHAGTLMIVAWGQFLDHDFTLTGTPLDSKNKNEPEECCNRPAHLKHPYCMEIHIPQDDYYYHKYNLKCQDFVRAFPGIRPGCRLGSRIPFNTLTGVIDGNTIYGVTENFARHLRSGYDGTMRMNPVFDKYGLKELLPPKVDIPEEGCVRLNKSQYCFESGEIRVNEQLVLTCMHTLMTREHNRVAKELAVINPHWDDEILYQEARRIVVAEIQHITFNEFLPMVLGKGTMEKYGLITEKEGYWDGYNPRVNPDIMDIFSAAAFRFGHSLLPTSVERWSKAHKFISSKKLSDLIRRPYDLYRPGIIDEYFMGLSNQIAQAMDDSITGEVTNRLLKKAGHGFGLDLVSFNIQRGRDFGLPGYAKVRELCGLEPMNTWDDMFTAMANTTVHKYKKIYEHPSEIDLWSGGVSEKPMAGSMLGPTFACIIAMQLSHTRRGDRFWYELPNQPSSFTAQQLAEIKKVKLSRIMCDNTDLIDSLQIYPMVLPDHLINPRVPCKAGVLPRMDLSKWIEFPIPNVETAPVFQQNDTIKEATKNNKTEGLHTEAKMIPCQNCTNLHKDFKLPTDLKSIHQVKTITVIEGSDTMLSNNALDIPDESIDKEDIITDIDDAISDIDRNTSFEESEDHQIMKRSVPRTNFTRKHEAEPLIRWREFDKVRHPIKREITSNGTRVRKRRLKIKPLDNKLKADDVTGEDERKATKLLEDIDTKTRTKESAANETPKNQTDMTPEFYKTDDLNGTEAQHKLMTQAIIQKPNGKKVVLQDKAYSEPIRKNVRFDDFDKTDRAFKTNINFYDDLPEYSKPYRHPTSYDSDSSYYKRPKGSSYSNPEKIYKYSHEDYEPYSKHKSPLEDSYDTYPKYKSPSLDTFEEGYHHKFTPNAYEDRDSYPKYKPSFDTYHDDNSKFKSRKPATDMIDVMPDHDAQYEYVPMEKDEDGNGKIKQHRPSSNRGKYNKGGYHSAHSKRPTSSSYDSGEDDAHGGGYGYSSLPQKSYYNPNKHTEYYGRPTNNHQSYKEDDRTSHRSKYREDTYPKYEKVPREYDYDTQGYGSEERRAYHGRTSHGSSKNREKPLTLTVNIDENEDHGDSDENQEDNDYDYASRDGSSGRIAARVTKVPKTLEEYHKLHKTWEKRPPKSGRTKVQKGDYDEPKRKPRPVQPKSKQSPRRFPPSRGKLEKPHVSYEFEGPNSHVAMDFVTPRTPAYDEHSERFKDTSGESDESDESPRRPNPIKISPEIDSVFDKFNDDSFRRITTEKPYKITRLAGKPLYSREENSAEFTRNIIRDITPKLNQRDKEDLYNKLKHEIEHKKYKSPSQDTSSRDDIFKDLGLDFNTQTKGNYKPNYGLDKSRTLIPKIGNGDDFEDAAPRKSWSFQHA